MYSLIDLDGTLIKTGLTIEQAERLVYYYIEKGEDYQII